MELEVTYLPDAITAYVLFHNFLSHQASDNVNCLLGVLHAEGWHEDAKDDDHNVVVNQGSEDVEVGAAPSGSKVVGVFWTLPWRSSGPSVVRDI